MKIIKKIQHRVIYNLGLYLKKPKTLQNVDNYAGLLTLSDQYVKDQIPKIIWLYWEGKENIFVNDCLRNIKRHNNNYIVNILNVETVKKYTLMDFEDPVIKSATPQQRADLIRFNLIYNYGGIWLDASVIVYENLDWIINLVNDCKKNSFAFYRKKNTEIDDFPVIENWLLASVKKNEFFKLWFDELYIALKFGVKEYIKDVKKEQNHHELFQKIGRLEYLVAYVACQKIMRRMLPSMVLINCDENALYFQVKNGWSKEKLLIDLGLGERSDIIPKLIKLVGKERYMIECYYKNSKFLKGSLLDFK